jgi:hypothetical protein
MHSDLSCPSIGRLQYIVQKTTCEGVHEHLIHAGLDECPVERANHDAGGKSSSGRAEAARG